MRWAAPLLLFLAAPAWSAALPEDLGGRRAVRGQRVLPAREPAELELLRQAEEELSPRHGGETSDESDRPEAWMAALRQPDLPVRFTPRVRRYLEFYKRDPRGRAIMRSWLEREGRYRPLFEAALERAGLPKALLYVSMIESGFDPLDRSSVGAVGLWQFMPEGASIYGLRVDYWVDERRDPEKATDAFVRYIGDLKARFGGWPLTLAAFDAGYGALLKAMRKYNTNDYFELCRFEDGLPWETTLYVPKVMAAALVGENRGAFGYAELPRAAPLAFARVTVARSTSLAALAKGAAVAPATLLALNPELRRGRTPPEAWSLRTPLGSAARLVARLHELEEPLGRYTLRAGERLEEVAARHGRSVKELRALNGTDDLGELRPGVVLLLPSGARPQATPPCDVALVAVPDKTAVVPGRKRLFYRTTGGESPAEVARHFEVAPEALGAWNNLDLDGRLAGDMVLQLWVPPDFDSSRVALVDPARVRLVTAGSNEFFDLVEARQGRKRQSYEIKPGDDLAKIGARFGLTVADLERINRFSAHHTKLTPGKRITVYVAMSAKERALAACPLVPNGLAEVPTAIPAAPTAATTGPPPAEPPRTLPAPPPPEPDTAAETERSAASREALYESIERFKKSVQLDPAAPHAGGGAATHLE